MRRDERFRLEGTSLLIRAVTARDDGEFVCELETKVSTVQYSTVQYSTVQFVCELETKVRRE